MIVWQFRQEKISGIQEDTCMVTRCISLPHPFQQPSALLILKDNGWSVYFLARQPVPSDEQLCGHLDPYTHHQNIIYSPGPGMFPRPEMLA